MTVGRIALKEALRFFLGLFGFAREIEGHERVLRKKVPECGGLAGLPGAGQDDPWPRLRRAIKACFNIPGNPHNAKYTIQSHFLHGLV